jgi:hypothetical protein
MRFCFKIGSYNGCALNLYSVLFITRPASSRCILQHHKNRPTFSSMLHKPQHNTNNLNSQNLIPKNSVNTNARDLRAIALSLVFFNMDKHCLTPAKLLNLLKSVLIENSTKNTSFKQWIDINSKDWPTTEKSTSSPVLLYKVGVVPHTELWLFVFFF